MANEPLHAPVDESGSCRWRNESWSSTHIWCARTRTTQSLSAPCTCCHFLLIWWIHILACVVMWFMLSFLHHSVAHWNCIVFPGGERNCGVHELICVRKGRAGQSSGRLTSDAWPAPSPTHWSPFAPTRLCRPVVLFPHRAIITMSGPVSSLCSHLSVLFISELQ